MDEKEFKQNFSELKNLSEWERGKFSAQIFIHSIVRDRRLQKSFMLETFENTANALAGIINYSRFANAFYIELLDAVEFLKNNDNLEELKKRIDQNIGKQGGGEKRFF